MKAKINYKSRKTIIIIAIAVILVIAAIAGTVAFIKGNNNAAAAMPEDEQTTIGDAQNNNGGDANQNGGNPSENPSDNPQTELPAVDANNNGTTTAGNDGTVTGNNDTTGTTNGGTTTNGNGTGATTGTTTGTAGTGATVPNQDYTQTTTVITENPWETKTIGWSPLSISAYTAAANLGINKPELSTEKLAYVQGDSLTEAPVHTAIQNGEVITYVIKVTNKGNLDATSIRTIDTVPEGTELVEGSITANGTESNGKITWKTDIKAGKPVELSFQVKVVADSINLIENTAKVNGTETPTTQNPVITSVKQASVLENGDLVDRDAKVGETIRYTITAINKSEVDGTTIITDKAPEGTTYVKKSASAGAVVADDGTITWKKVTVPAGEEVTVSFDVTVNKEIYNEETQQNESVKSVKNTATVGTIPTGEVETKVANITTTKASQPSATPLHELDTITYRLIATNYGNGTGTVTISDKIPEGTTLVGDVTVTGDTTKYDETQLKNGIAVEVKQSEAKTVTFTVRINVFKLGDKNVTEENGRTIRTIDNLVATQDGATITPGTSDKVEKEYTSVKVTKSWNDANNAEGLRQPVTFRLYTGDATTGYTATNYTVTASADTNWVADFGDKLDKNDDNGIINYTVKEETTLEKYKPNTQAVANGGTITNELDENQVTTTLKVTKSWNDANNAEGLRQPVTFKLYTGDATTGYTATNYTATASADTNWVATFTGVQKYDANKNEIVYTIKEETTLEKYKANTQAVANGGTITNELDENQVTTTLKVTKSWNDANNAEGLRQPVTFKLYTGDATTGYTATNYTATASADTNWVATFTGVQKYDANKNEIVYTIKEETTLEKYKPNTQVVANGGTITNELDYTAFTKKVTVTKVWDDNNNAPVEGENGPRPTTPITIVFKGGENDIEKTLGGTGDTWTQSYDLPKYDSNGNEITYTVDEKTVPAWYVKSSVETTTDSTTKIPTTTITNSIPRIEVTKKIVTLNGAIPTNTVAAVAGDVIGYEITVENIGSIDLTNVTVVDEMTNGKDVYANYNTDKKELSGKLVDGVVANINKLAVNSGKQTYTVYYKVDADDVKNISDASSSTIDNTVTATGQYTDGTNTVRTVEDFDEESAGIKASSIISIEKTQKAGTVELDENGKDEAGNIVKVTPGTVMTYTIKVSNEGNTLQENVVVTDIMTINGNARTFTITSVKVEGKDRTYTTENGTISIGNLAVGEEAIITATYTVQETTDMAIASQDIINHVSVVSDSNNDSNNPIEDEVKVPTEAWAPIITVSKSGKLANGKDANGNAAEYGNTITYTLKAENDGNATGTQILKDSDLENLLNSNKVSNVENIVVNNFDNAGNSIKDESKKVSDIISGITVNVPAGKTASVTFTVTVTACPDSDNPISNSVEGGTTPVETPVVKTINAKSNTGKVSGANYVLIIDTSSSMTSNYVDKKNETTRFKAAKEAISDLATFLFAKDSETTSKISIVQFNREEDTKIVSVGDQIVFGVEDYKNGNITQLIENIKTHSGTNIEAGLKKAGDLLYDNKTGIHKQGLTTNSKDVLILLSDGSPYQGELEPYKLGKIARKQLNRKGEGITNDIYSIAFGTSESKDTLQAISPNKVYLSSNKEDLFKTFKDIVYEAGDSTPVTLTKASQVIYTGNKEIADDKEITITYDGLKAPLTYKFTAPGTSEDGVLTYAVKDGTYTLTFNLTAALLDKENILITYYVK